ncbi:hypothetical protein HK102_006678, partial [Quaeritorhiza haematococci]
MTAPSNTDTTTSAAAAGTTTTKPTAADGTANGSSTPTLFEPVSSPPPSAFAIGKDAAKPVVATLYLKDGTAYQGISF